MKIHKDVFYSYLDLGFFKIYLIKHTSAFLCEMTRENSVLVSREQ